MSLYQQNSTSSNQYQKSTMTGSNILLFNQYHIVHINYFRVFNPLTILAQVYNSAQTVILAVQMIIFSKLLVSYCLTHFPILLCNKNVFIITVFCFFLHPLHFMNWPHTSDKD